MLVVLGLIVVRTTSLAWPFMSSNPGYAFDSNWVPDKDSYGALPFVIGTLVSSLIAMVLAVPAGVGIALFLNEVAPRRTRGLLVYAVELLAAVPSVIYGLWGIFVMVPFLVAHVYPTLTSALDWAPYMSGPVGTGRSLLTAGLLLGLMVIPIVTAFSREAIALVPAAQREAAVGLGATQWEVLRQAVLPYARSGIIGAAVLALGRALGETIAVLLVIGSFTRIPASLFGPGQSMAGVIANQFAESSGAKTQALIAIGVLLFVITIVVNVIAQVFVRRSIKAMA